MLSHFYVSNMLSSSKLQMQLQMLFVLERHEMLSQMYKILNTHMLFKGLFNTDLVFRHTCSNLKVLCGVGERRLKHVTENNSTLQFSVSEESETSARRSCLLRTFQCRH